MNNYNLFQGLDRHPMTLLVLTLLGRPSLDEVRARVEADPAELRTRSWPDGMLPLHVALNMVVARKGVVRYLLERYPQSAREWSSANDNNNNNEGGRATTPAPSGSLPIHMACHHWTPTRRAASNNQDNDDEDVLDIVKVLVEFWPESVEARDGRGRLPLHVARDVHVIRFLHQLHPNAIHEPDQEGKLPLHWAVEMGYPFPALRLLTELSPQAVRAKDNRGRIPLHCITGETKLKAVRRLVGMWSDSVHQLDDDGYVPLHYGAAAAEDVMETGIVRFLVGRGPNTARVRATSDGNLPLHVVARTPRQCTDVFYGGAILNLLQAWPESVRERNEDGLLPIHMAAIAGKVDDVQYLGHPCPASIRERSESGWLAIHFVLQGFHVPGTEPDNLFVDHRLGAARYLLDQFPESVTEPTTREGYLPLHVAARGGFGRHPDPHERDGIARKELELFQRLVRMSPTAVRVLSHDLLLPAHYAVAIGMCTLGTTQFLLDQFPAAIRLRDAQEKNMLHMSIERDQPDPDTVQYLAQQRPDMLQENDRDGSTPLHSAAAQPRTHPPTAQGVPDPLREIVRFLVGAHAQSMLEVDRSGSLPLHAALANDDPDPDVVRMLVEAQPQAMSKPNGKGQLPIHVYLSRTKPSEPIASFLMEQCPQTLLVADWQGFLPLHTLVAQGGTVPFELVELLVKKCPESVHHKDVKGNLPLTIAASSPEADLNVLFILATKWPEAVHGKGIHCQCTRGGGGTSVAAHA